MQPVAAPPSHCCSKSRACCRRTLLVAGFLAVSLLLAGCSGGGIYANIGIAGPSIDLGPVSVRTGVNLGRWL